MARTTTIIIAAMGKLVLAQSPTPRMITKALQVASPAPMAYHCSAGWGRSSSAPQKNRAQQPSIHSQNYGGACPCQDIGQRTIYVRAHQACSLGQHQQRHHREGKA